MDWVVTRLLYYDAATKSVRGLNGVAGAASADARAGAGGRRRRREPTACRQRALRHRAGAAAYWADCVKDLGGCRWRAYWRRRSHWPRRTIHAVAAQLWSDNAHQLLDRWGGLEGNPGAASLLVDGRPPRHGEVLRNPELAATLRTLASEGAEGFYQGPVAEAIVKCIHAKGGVMSLEDLAAHKTERVSPISTTFRGKTVELPPGSGLSSPDGPRDARSAATVRRATGGRPVPSGSAPNGLREGLPSIGDGAPASADAHLAEARAVSAALENLGTDTTYLCCVDAAGNACSFICSNFRARLGIGAGGCGFSLQNRGRNFVLREGHRCIGPVVDRHTISQAW